MEACDLRSASQPGQDFPQLRLQGMLEVKGRAVGEAHHRGQFAQSQELGGDQVEASELPRV